MIEKRDPRSHIREDGTAKESYATREEAARVADDIWARTQRPQGAYLCSQKPDHWHVGSGNSSLRP